MLKLLFASSDCEVYGAEAGKDISIPLKFALPGKERQDSVRSGLQVGLYLADYSNTLL